MKKVVSVLLAILMMASVFAGCSKGSSFDGGKGKNKDITTVEVTLPVPTDAEAIVDVTTALAVDYYLLGRAYLDEFLNYDLSTLNEQNEGEYKALLENAVKAFENSDKTTEVLNEALNVWEKEPANEAKPTSKVMAMTSGFSFGITAYAAEMGSKEWAQNIVDTYDKAPAGKGIRTLSTQLGTDSKHAYSQLKMALAVLEGEEYTAIADKANTAVKTATVLKTAGTAAGLVIAVATAPASGALATAVSTGGITVSGINTVLEIGSTASILYTNGDDNEFSMACDKTEAQLAPIGQIFAVAGLASSLMDVGKTAGEIVKNGYNSLDAKSKTDLGINTFGIISYGAGAINDYVNGGSILSGTFTKGEDGIKFTLKETLTGTEPEQKQNVKEVLVSSGMDETKVDEAINKAAENKTAEPVTFRTDSIPTEIARSIISQDTTKDDGFDLETYLNNLRAVLKELIDVEKEVESDGGNWVEPYSYFNVSNIVELYPLLKSNGILKLKVTPVAYDNNGAGQVDLISGAEPFVIDLTNGSVTTYTASYADHPKYTSQPSTYDLTLTFTANGSRDLFRVDSTHTENKHSGDSVTETDADCIIYNMNADVMRDYELKAIQIDNHTPVTVIFNVDQVLLP